MKEVTRSDRNARWLAVLGVLLYTAILRWAYPAVGPSIYGPGFPYEALPLEVRLVSWLLSLAPAYWMPVRLNRPSVAAYWMLYLVVIIPCCFIPLHVARGKVDEIAPYVLTLWSCFAVLGTIYALPANPVKRPALSKKLFYGGLCLVAILLILGVGLGTGFRVDLDLSTVYARRAEAREVAGARSANLYLASTLGNSIAPVLFAIGIAYRKWICLAVSLAGLVAVFSLTGLKSVFFTPVLMLGILLLIRKAPNSSAAWLPMLSAGVGAVALGLFYVMGNLTLSLLFLHRLCFTPATLSTYYFEFFSNNPKVFLSDSILSAFFERPYEKNVGPMIGEVYFGTEVNATTGVWAQGFAHFGYAGMGLATLCVAIVFITIDRLSVGRGREAAAMMMALIGVFWSNVALHTSLISNGIIATLLCFWLMPRMSAEAKPVSEPNQGLANGEAVPA